MSFTGSLWVVLLAMISVIAAISARAESLVLAPEGFRVEDRFVFEPRILGGFAGLAYSPAGEPIVYEGGEIRLCRSAGPVVLERFEPPVFGSFLVVAADGVSLIFGESSAGNIYRVPLAGGERALVDNLAFAFDLAFDAAGRGYISVLTNNPENEIVLLDTDPENVNRSIIVNIPGLSGPVAFDPDGNLYYGTVDFSGDPLRQSLHRFTPDQLEAAVAGEPVDFSQGEVLLTEMEGFFNLRWHDGKLYFTELGFSSGVGTVQVIDPAANFSVAVFASIPSSTGILSPSYLAARPGTRAFQPGGGPHGGSLLVAYSDFASVSNVAEITPELWFVRGRVNDDARVDLADAITLLSFLFSGGSAPEPREAGDVNDDGSIDLSDAVYLLDFLFRGRAAPPAPFPEPGPEPTP